MKMVGRHRNRVVEWHSKACQHCGVYGIPADSTCKRCQISTHSQCLEFREGLCDMCYEDVDEDIQCCLCQQPDNWDRPDSTDRLTKRVVCFGRTWTEVQYAIEDLASQGYIPVVIDERIEENTLFDVDKLPMTGTRKMVTTQDGKVFTSDPLVAHTWCAACLFHISPSLPNEWRLRILCALHTSVTLVCGLSMNPPVEERSTFETHECVFCHSKKGWTTFCFYHLAKNAGCPVCRQGPQLPAKLKTNHAFHPSCAVRWGMQRICRAEGIGMLCFVCKHFKAMHFKHLKPWLDFPSGINEFLPGQLDSFSLIPEEGTAFKGERYERKSDEANVAPAVPCHGRVGMQSAILEALDGGDITLKKIRRK